MNARDREHLFADLRRIREMLHQEELRRAIRYLERLLDQHDELHKPPAQCGDSIKRNGGN